jgi:hypothetical protein
MDLLAVVSRPDFPSGSGPVGDYFGFDRLIQANPGWSAVVLRLNSPGIEVDWTPGRFLVRTPERDWFDLAEVRTAVYLPICLEPEETLLSSVRPDSAWPQFEAEQWRPIGAMFDARLDAMSDGARCINRPSVTKRTNNKLLQFELLAAAGFELPATRVRLGYPRTGALADRSSLVSKNVSEGGWRSETEFSPARLLTGADLSEGWPTVWQAPIVSSDELRVYVMGDSVTAVALQRDPEVIDVRSVNEGKPSGSIVDIRDSWRASLVAMTRCLGLDYAVIDAMPVADTLHVLEVNANGVWWFLPADVRGELEARFHEWLASVVNTPGTDRRSRRTSFA